MTTAVNIANIALNNLGDKTITAFSDNNAQAFATKARLTDVINSVLRAHPWNCLVRRATLAQNSSAPTWGYTYAYNLPTDPYCLRVLRLEKLYLDYKVEGRTIVSDEQTMKIKFIARVTDPNEYDTLLIESIAARLAADICYGITNSNALVANMVALYESKLKEARFVDSTEGMPGESEGADIGSIQADTFINSRY